MRLYLFLRKYLGIISHQCMKWTAWKLLIRHLGRTGSRSKMKALKQQVPNRWKASINQSSTCEKGSRREFTQVAIHFEWSRITRPKQEQTKVRWVSSQTHPQRTFIMKNKDLTISWTSPSRRSCTIWVTYLDQSAHRIISEEKLILWQADTRRLEWPHISKLSRKEEPWLHTIDLEDSIARRIKLHKAPIISKGLKDSWTWIRPWLM